MYLKIIAVLYFIATVRHCFCNYDVIQNPHHVGKRALIFPRYSIWQFTYGVTAPVILPNRSINFSMCCQLNYEFPWDYSHWFPSIYWGRELVNGNSSFFDVDRHTFYKHATQFLEGFGVKGEACLLRTICELAETPLETEKSNTIFEKIIHFIFTPSEDPITHLPSEDSLVYKLLHAENVGRIDGKCDKAYSDCEFSLIDLITAKYKIF